MDTSRQEIYNSMFQRMNMVNYHLFSMNVQEPGPLKGVQLTKGVVLYPPNPNDPKKATRKKPLGCRTVFVDGLPEEITPEIIKELFGSCGEIDSIRMSGKHFCHVRFTNRKSVDKAMCFSGYRLKFISTVESLYGVKLHVDYAESRNDLHEYECEQRALQRKLRHVEEWMEEIVQSPSSRASVVDYSEHEATLLAEKLKKEDTFKQALFVLITWLKRGECNKKNVSIFYSMIQTCSLKHVRRLAKEMSECENEINKAKMVYEGEINKAKQQMQNIVLQFNEIKSLFNTVSLQKVWDHFTKAQRKNIEAYEKETEKVKNNCIKEMINKRVEDEMEISEDEDDSANVSKKIQDNSDNKNKCNRDIKLSDENDYLRCQLEAANSEIMILKSALYAKECQVQALELTVKNSTKNVKNLFQKRPADEAEFKELDAFQSKKKSF